MSNDYKTRCVVSGSAEKVAEFERLMFVSRQDGAVVFDFTRILPIPACFDDEPIVSTTAEVLALLQNTVDAPQIWARLARFKPEMGNWDAVYAVDRARMEQIIENVLPGTIARAKHSALCFSETGHFDRISWAYANWDTKWNAEDTVLEVERPGFLRFTFTTANGVPHPVFDALAKKFPTLKIECAYFTEYGDFYGGRVYLCQTPTLN